MGSERSVPVLARLLGQPPSRKWRVMLWNESATRADAALLDALASAAGNTRIGIVNTLGRHRARTAVEKLKGCWGARMRRLRLRGRCAGEHRGCTAQTALSAPWTKRCLNSASF